MCENTKPESITREEKKKKTPLFLSWYLIVKEHQQVPWNLEADVSEDMYFVICHAGHITLSLDG